MAQEMIGNPLAFYAFAYLVSFSGVLIPGPMTAVTIAKGYKESKAGLKISLGHGLVEIPLILMIYFGFTSFFQDQDSRLITLISLSGGLMLSYMGLAMFRLRKTIIERGKDLPVSSLGAGVITTGGNPSFFIWWATAGALLVLNASIFGPLGIILFIILHESADLLWYGLLSYGTNRSKNYLPPYFHQNLFGLLSILLMGFGLWFIMRAL